MRLPDFSFRRLLVLVGCLAFASCGDSRTSEERGEVFLGLTQDSGPVGLNSTGRGVFANVLLDRDSVLVTYQIANGSLTEGKSLYYRRYDRDFKEIVGETLAIDVVDHPVFQGDLGDHKLVLLNDRIYMIAMLSWSPYSALLEFDRSFKQLSDAVLIGDADTDVFTDMGFATDGESLYVQCFYQTADSEPEDWAARIYRYDTSLSLVDSTIVQPEFGTFMTGNSLIYVPAGHMGGEEDRLQIFSTNKDHGNKDRIGIHTFAIRKDDLSLIEGSTKTIIEEELDAYFPTGPSWNEKHQIWIVGFTMEEKSGDLTTKELGPSFVKVFDADWNLLQQIQLNAGDPGMRVMTNTQGEDVYIVYDEMDKEGKSEFSNAKAEHYKIESSF